MRVQEAEKQQEIDRKMKELDKLNQERARKAELELARREQQQRVIAQMKVHALREQQDQER